MKFHRSAAVQERYKFRGSLRVPIASLQGIAERPLPCSYNVLQFVCALSRRKRGFESLRGRQLIQQLRRDFVRITCTARTTDSPYYCPKLPPTAFQDFHL